MKAFTKEHKEEWVKKAEDAGLTKEQAEFMWEELFVMLGLVLK